MNSLCNHLQVLGLTLRSSQINYLCFLQFRAGNRRLMMLLWEVFSTECPTGIDEYLFSLFRRTALRLLSDEQLKSFYSIASYFRLINSFKSAILLKDTSKNASLNVKNFLNSFHGSDINRMLFLVPVDVSFKYENPIAGQIS